MEDKEVIAIQYRKISELEEENKKLKEEIRFLEECLDNKEKVNKQLREEIWKLKSYWPLHMDINGERITSSWPCL